MVPQLILPDQHDAGFSLIELMVVVAVLAVLAVGASLSAGRTGGGQGDMQRFSQQFELARALAIQGRQARGMWVTPQGFSMTELESDGWAEAGQQRRWNKPVSLQIPPRAGAGITSLKAPNIIVLPNGTVSDFSIRFNIGAAASTRCTHEDNAGLICG